MRRSSARLLSELGPSEAVRRFARKYGSPRTRTLYLDSLKRYFTWLRGQGVQLNPDALIEDNLKAMYESKATDVKTKRRHREYLDRYVNDYLVKRGLREWTRSSTTAAISAIRSEGSEVEDTIVLIDRLEGTGKDEKILEMEKWRLASLAD